MKCDPVSPLAALFDIHLFDVCTLHTVWWVLQVLVLPLLTIVTQGLVFQREKKAWGKCDGESCVSFFCPHSDLSDKRTEVYCVSSSV